VASRVIAPFSLLLVVGTLPLLAVSPQAALSTGSSGSKGEKMADKKVERSGRQRPLTPTKKMEAALSDPGTMNIADAAHDKGKSALVDKFREREERWRREQALHDQQAAHSTERPHPQTPETGRTPEPAGQEEGGRQ